MSDDNEPYLKVSCDTIRKKINIFLATKEMTQTAFLLAIGKVNNNSYRNFMRLKGSNGGCNNGTFYGAAKFFYDRDQAEKQAAKEQKAKDKKRPASELSTDANTSAQDSVNKMFKVSDAGTAASTVPSSTAAASSSANTTHTAATPPALPELPYDLPVFDDCDEVRGKIARLFMSKVMTQANFAKTIHLTAGKLLRVTKCCAVARCNSRLRMSFLRLRYCLCVKI
jgi:hypothetical protein